MCAKQMQMLASQLQRPTRLLFTTKLLLPQSLLGQIHIDVSLWPHPHLTLSVVSLATPSFTTLAM